MFKKTGLDLWTGDTYPKFGIYRGEKGDHDDSNDDGNTFDLYVYRIQLSDASLEEVSSSSGLSGNAGDDLISGGANSTLSTDSALPTETSSPENEGA